MFLFFSTSVNSKNIDAFACRSNDQKTILNRLILYDENKHVDQQVNPENKIHSLQSNENVNLIYSIMELSILKIIFIIFLFMYICNF